MGSRHNRKRTRSRPRNRRPSRSSSLDSLDSVSFDPVPSPPLSPFAFAHRPPTHWHAQYAAWQARLRVEHDRETVEHPRQRAEVAASAVVDAQCVRVFGGQLGEERSLCEPMLRVVMGLFDGCVDYDDP
ncbi:hypothetical protein P152DRAFT_474486 [Eremomyces bilateralis CBS 781.70]|uniref:Uncharacterized protein n=1 Tax=Eremomyces bilateralis CBS 781.70 TaxID=1392243 RepID=A0A6G1G0X9_9PEZI|nr:uncharacterized protein P152DRAFT_474486 [Eremomyces bilateralis CBS 781.70]KAF1811765.1 hypothetical protein P152DRAFT_474486 [Eremomyces bilateralis CBS 781.70]